MKRIFITLIQLLCIQFLVSAQDQKAREILAKVNESLQQTKSIYYEYEYQGWGKLNGHFNGEVKISKEKGLQLSVKLNTLNAKNDIIKEELIYTNGNNIKLLDRTKKLYKFGTAQNGSAYLMSYAWYAVFRESLMPNAFGAALKNETVKYLGTNDINNTECHVISMKNPWGDTQYWYFGIKDFQIYGQKQENKNPEVEGGFTFTVNQLKVNLVFSPKEFQVVVPNDFKSYNEDRRSLIVGSAAPNWVLENGSGKKVSDKELKGKVVVLDFWASWCNPCWKIMPVINQIKSDYNSKKVAVFGVNVWENPKLNIPDYLKKKNLDHYQVLFDKDATAAKSFKIAALPLVVVISPEGKIAYINSGIDTNMEKNIREAIDKFIQ